MKLSDGILRTIFPKRCVGCNRVIPFKSELCPDCLKKLPNLEIDSEGSCRRCGVPKKLCTCKGHSTEFEGTVAPFIYGGIIKNAIKDIKALKNAQPVDFLASHMAEAVKEAGFPAADFVTCVPMSKKEFRARGYNPAQLLAKATADRLDIPFEKNAISKIYDTIPQRALPSSLRRGNIFGVYEADEDLTFAKTVLLVDDVMTTGNTVNECAKMLRLSGAYQVFCVVAAKTVIEKTEDKKDD